MTGIYKYHAFSLTSDMVPPLPFMVKSRPVSR